MITFNNTLTAPKNSPMDRYFPYMGELVRVIVYCPYICVINVFVVSSCILVSHINKLKKWLFYIYLLTTITKALYQSSKKDMSLLFTCPQLTVEESSLLAAAARMLLHVL